MRSIILPYPIFCRLVGSWPKCNATFQGPLRQLSAAALTQIPQQASKDGHLHTKLQKESNPECSKIYFIMGRSWWESVNEIRPAKNPQAFPCNGIQFTTVYAVASLRLLGLAYWSPGPKTTPSIHRWVYETWLSVAIPKLHSMQHLLPEPTKQLCIQNIQNDMFQRKWKTWIDEKDLTDAIPGWED